MIRSRFRPFHVGRRSSAARPVAAALVAASLALLAAPASAQSGPTSQGATRPATVAGTSSPGRAAAKPAAKPAAKSPGKPTGTAAGRRARAPRRLTARERIAADIGVASQQIRRAMVVQDTSTLAQLWEEEYTFTSLSGETYSKSDRLESVMSPAFLVDEAAEVLPSELDIVRVYGNVAVVQSRLAPPGTAKSGSRGGRAKLLSVWVRGRDGKWRTVAAQATAVDMPLAAPAKKKR